VRSFETFPEQDDAKRLLAAALREGPAHAYLFHGPPGVGKRRAALAFAAEILGARERVERGTHPDLYVLEPLGDQIRIDPIRELRRDLHMRPFEARRRVYLVFGAHLMNDDAADALLKDLEEPPGYAVIILVADELGPLPQTIRSRCQLVPFRRLSRAAIKAHLAARGLSGDALEVAARVAAGRLDRAERLLDKTGSEHRAAVLALARAVYRDPAFEPAKGAAAVGEIARARGGDARVRVEEVAREAREAGRDESDRDVEQRARRAERGAERDEVLLSLDVLASWYRDLVVCAVGAEDAALNSDRLPELAEDARPGVAVRAERAAEAVRDVWRTFEFNVQPGLALEALFVRLRREMSTLALEAEAG
jgi:DNA polymerase-3 subunit delta'